MSVRFGFQKGIFHNKFSVVDNVRVEIRYYNYTHHATEANNENQVYLGTPGIVQRYRDHFDELWNEATPVEISLRKAGSQTAPE